MKSTLLIAVLAALALNHYSDAASLNRVRRQLVPAEFRNINIETYLKNPRSVLFQLKCIVYDGPCDRIGKYLKVTIPELITGTCQHCSPSDRQTAGRLVAHIQKNYPKEWHDAIRKYQGGQSVKPEDANKFESLTGVKIETELVASTAAPAPVTVAVPVSSSVAPPVAPVVVSVAPKVEAEKPVEAVVATPESKPEVAAPAVSVPVASVPVAVAPVGEADPVVTTTRSA